MAIGAPVLTAAGVDALDAVADVDVTEANLFDNPLEPVPDADASLEADTAAAIAASLKADDPTIDAATAAAIQRAMYDKSPPRPDDAASEPVPSSQPQRPTKPKYALFSCANSTNCFELNRAPMTHSSLVRAFANSPGEMLPSDHAHCNGRMKAATYFMAMLGGSTTPAPHKFSECVHNWPSLFSSPEALERLRWDMLGICIANDDPIGLQYMWGGLRADCKDPDGPTMPERVRKSLLDAQTVREATIMRMLRTVICACRKPRLGMLLLRGLHREAVFCQPFSFTGRRDLSAMAVAVADAVFGADKTRKTGYDEDHATWVASFVEKAPKPTDEFPCVPDKASDLEAWKQLICAILQIVGVDAMPHRVVEMLPRDRTYSVGMLHVAVRCAEHDTFLLDELLARKTWGPAALSEAYNEALDPFQGVRGPNLPKLLKMLYAQQLAEWCGNATQRAKGVVTSIDDLARPWTTVVSRARGYAEIDVDAMSTVLMPANEPSRVTYTYTESGEQEEANAYDPSVWMDILSAMVAAHEPDSRDAAGSRDWDHTSPLFSSLMKIAIRACVGNRNKTHLVSYFLSLDCEKGRDGVFGTHDWYDIPRLVAEVAEHHAEVFPMLIKAMIGQTTGAVLQRNLTLFGTGFCSCVLAGLKEPARLIVQALSDNGHALPGTVVNTRGPSSSSKTEPTLECWISELGKGATAAERAQFGGNLASLINKETEADFKAILSCSPWSQPQLNGALVEAVRLQRAIPAQVLITPPYNAKLPDGAPRSAWLEAIAEYVYRPAGAGAEAVCAGLRSQAVALDSLAVPTNNNNKRDAAMAGLPPVPPAPQPPPPLRRVRTA